MHKDKELIDKLQTINELRNSKDLYEEQNNKMEMEFKKMKTDY